jgi:hypothetical protein
VSAIDIGIAITFLVLVVLLVRAANVLGRNPHQQIRAHEELIGGKFPNEMTHDAKLAAINRAGVSPTNPGRIWAVIVAVVAFMALLVWQR